MNDILSSWTILGPKLPAYKAGIDRWRMRMPAVRAACLLFEGFDPAAVRFREEELEGQERLKAG